MKNIIFVIFVYISTLAFGSQVIFYNSYSDYKNKKGIDKGEFKELSVSKISTRIKVIDNNKKATYENKDLEKIWAFETEGVLYRYFKGELLEVLHVGEKVTVYENAMNRINAANERKDYKFGDNKYTVFLFSSGATGEPTMLIISLKGKIKENFRENFPSFSSLFDNLEKHYQDKKSYSPLKILQTFKDFDQK